MSDDYKNRQGMALDEIEPDYDTAPPQTLTRSRHINDVFWLAGRAPVEGQEHYEVMFVSIAPEEEEVARNRKSTFGFNIQVPPEYLKGSNGIVKDVALRAGLDIDKSYYTCVVKWLLPRTKRARPPMKTLKYGLPVLFDEIERIKPRIIVCLGKLAFDMLSDKKMSFDDAHGGWFWSSKAQAHLYVTYPPYSLVTKPEMYETFRIDFMEVKRKLDLIHNVDIGELPARWEVIRDEHSLRKWVERMKILKALKRDQWGPTIPWEKIDELSAAIKDRAAQLRIEWDTATRTEWEASVVRAARQIGKSETQMAYADAASRAIPYQPYEPIDQAVGAHLRSRALAEVIKREGLIAAEESSSTATWHVGDRKPTVTHTGQQFLVAVDCEWHGRQHVDGNLRTIQFAWSESDAVVIEFRNEKNEFSFELDDRNIDRSLSVLYPLEYGDYYDEVLEWERGIDFDDLNGSPEELEFERREMGIGDPEPDWSDSEWFKPAMIERARYAAVGNIIGEVLNDEDVRYIGHHFSADAPWMRYWLNLDTYRRCILDTEFAQQTIDESSELGLERGIAMKYTTLGFYNQELLEWKRENKKLCEDGYGYIPSDIIIPYSAYDVIAPFRAYPRIRKQLDGQQLTHYYDTILNPFVTDVFTEFAMTGLPMDRQRMDEMRELFHFARRRLEIGLKTRIHQEARAGVMAALMDEVGMDSILLARQVLNAPTEADAVELLKSHVKFEEIPKWIKRVKHLFGSKDFNIRSPDMLRMWLYDVEGLTPIKSTNQKAKGMPSQSWDKVLELPADRQKLFTPAVDKQTLQILSETFPTLDELLSLNAVGNVCKAFLKEATTYKVKKDGDGDLLGTETEEVSHFSMEMMVLAPDGVTVDGVFYDNEEIAEDVMLDIEENPDTPTSVREANRMAFESARERAARAEELDKLDAEMSTDYLDDADDEVEHVKENGLHAWLSSEDRVLGMYSCTETGRPRSWRPNTLNWPSYVNKRIGIAVLKAVKEANEEGDLPDTLVKWLDASDERDIPSIRSCVKAPPGWVMVESDYRTAEMVGLAIISGDKQFTRILREPDPEWACLKPGSIGDYVRVRYSDPVDNGIPAAAQDPQFIMSVWKDSKKLGDVTEDDLARNPDGTVKHRGYDIHWSVVERTYERPRETMIEKIHRNAGKVLNFSSAYGASPASLERKIESDTGVKPEPGTGEKGLEAIAARQPRASQFLEEMAMVPKTVGYARAASGRIRHCILHGRNSDISWRVRNSQESALGREMRNFP